MFHAWTLLWHVMLLSVQHMPAWVASACRTVSHALWWQHNSSLVFWTNVFTSTQQCSIIQIICICKYCKANTWWWFRLYLLPLYQCTQAIHISDLYWYEWHFTTNLLPQTLPRFHVKFDKNYSGRSFHIVNISHYSIRWNQAKSTGIHGGAHPKF